MAAVREDIHIRAAAAAVYERVAHLEATLQWLPPTFREPSVEDDRLDFALSLPLDRREAHLAVAEREEPRYVRLSAVNGNGAAGAVESLTWALHAESPQNVHVTVEMAYAPSNNLLGGLFEAALHAPMRRQALRDALWRLKQVCEGREPTGHPLGEGPRPR